MTITRNRTAAKTHGWAFGLNYETNTDRDSKGLYRYRAFSVCLATHIYGITLRSRL